MMFPPLQTSKNVTLQLNDKVVELLAAHEHLPRGGGCAWLLLYMYVHKLKDDISTL